MVLENHHWKIKEKEQEVFRGHSVLLSVTVTAFLTATSFLIHWLIYCSFSMNKTIDLTCDLGSNSVEHCLDHVTHLKRNIMLILQPINTFSFSFCYLKPGTGFELLLLGGSDLGADLYCEALVHYSNFLPFPCSILRHSSRFTQFKL